MFRATGKQKYLDVAEYFIAERGRPHPDMKPYTEKAFEMYNERAYKQDHLPVVEQDRAVGHAVRAMYLYAGVADVAALTAAVPPTTDAAARAKVEALRKFLETLHISLPKGGVLRTEQFNHILDRVKGQDVEKLVNEVVLRSQAQAEYAAENYGHFGLNLRRYAHFTSPIRRYADLIVHRGLIRARNFGSDGLPESQDQRTLGEIAACEERLQQAGQVLAQALGAVRSQQEQLAKDVVAHVPAVQARNKGLQALMAELGTVAGEVQGLNDIIVQKGGPNGETPTTADAMSAVTPSNRNTGTAYTKISITSSATALSRHRRGSSVPRCNLVDTRAARMLPSAPESSRNGGTSTRSAG